MDGGVRIATILDLAQVQGERARCWPRLPALSATPCFWLTGIQLPYQSVPELQQHVFKSRYNNLEEYLQCFGYTRRPMPPRNSLHTLCVQLDVQRGADRWGSRAHSIRVSRGLVYATAWRLMPGLDRHAGSGAALASHATCATWKCVMLRSSLQTLSPRCVHVSSPPLSERPASPGSSTQSGGGGRCGAQKAGGLGLESVLRHINNGLARAKAEFNANVCAPAT